MRAVLSGSYRRDLDGLRRSFEALRASGCTVVSPHTVDFTAEVNGFVLAEHERDDEPAAIEARHLSAIESSDLVWLHSPDGYVGRSASMELGFAFAHGVPVYSDAAPADLALQPLVQVVSAVAEAVAHLRQQAQDPGRPLRRLQRYYALVAAERGYDEETAQDTMLLLTEEVGELARAIRKRIGLQRDGSSESGGAAEELADVQLYVVHLANILGVDLSAAVTAKERENDRRHSARRLKSA